MNITEHLILTPFLILDNGTKIDMTKEFGRYGYRTMWQIVQSCLLTIFACTWITIHSNIPAHRCWPARLYYKTHLWIVDVVMPELLLLWAAKQFFAARRLAHGALAGGTERVGATDTKENGALISGTERADATDTKDKKIPWCCSLTGCLQRLWRMVGCKESPSKLPHHRDRDVVARASSDPEKGKHDAPNLTKTQRFFALMGGCEDEAGRIYSHHWVSDNFVKMPTDEEIMDKSKRNTFVKLLAFAEAIWFVSVTIYRIQSRVLFATEIEIVTLTFAWISVLTTLLWWYKPQSVDLPLPHHPNPNPTHDALPPNCLRLATSMLRGNDKEDKFISKSEIYAYSGQLSWQDTTWAVFLASLCGSLSGICHLVVASLHGGLALTHGRIWFYLALAGSAFPFYLLPVALISFCKGSQTPKGAKDFLHHALKVAQWILFFSGIARVLLMLALAYFMFTPYGVGAYLTPKWSKHIPHPF